MANISTVYGDYFLRETTIIKIKDKERVKNGNEWNG